MGLNGCLALGAFLVSGFVVACLFAGFGEVGWAFPVSVCYWFLELVVCLALTLGVAL